MPALVDDLLRQGRWPDSQGYSGRPVVAGSPVEAIMHGENEIWLFGPPFHTVDDNLEWFEQFREPGHIDFAKAVIIGDFGPGTESPIVLDFTSEPAQVKALQITGYHPNPRAGSAPWPEGYSFGFEGHWVTLASSIEEFVERLGL